MPPMNHPPYVLGKLSEDSRKQIEQSTTTIIKRLEVLPTEALPVNARPASVEEMGVTFWARLRQLTDMERNVVVIRNKLNKAREARLRDQGAKGDKGLVKLTDLMDVVNEYKRRDNRTNSPTQPPRPQAQQQKSKKRKSQEKGTGDQIRKKRKVDKPESLPPPKSRKKKAKETPTVLKRRPMDRRQGPSREERDRSKQYLESMLREDITPEDALGFQRQQQEMNDNDDDQPLMLSRSGWTAINIPRSATPSGVEDLPANIDETHRSQRVSLRDLNATMKTPSDPSTAMESSLTNHEIKPTEVTSQVNAKDQKISKHAPEQSPSPDISQSIQADDSYAQLQPLDAMAIRKHGRTSHTAASRHKSVSLARKVFRDKDGKLVRASYPDWRVLTPQTESYERTRIEPPRDFEKSSTLSNDNTPDASSGYEADDVPSDTTDSNSNDNDNEHERDGKEDESSSQDVDDSHPGESSTSSSDSSSNDDQHGEDGKSSKVPLDIPDNEEPHQRSTTDSNPSSNSSSGVDSNSDPPTNPDATNTARESSHERSNSTSSTSPDTPTPTDYNSDNEQADEFNNTEEEDILPWNDEDDPLNLDSYNIPGSASSDDDYQSSSDEGSNSSNPGAFARTRNTETRTYSLRTRYPSKSSQPINFEDEKEDEEEERTVTITSEAELEAAAERLLAFARQDDSSDSDHNEEEKDYDSITQTQKRRQSSNGNDNDNENDKKKKKPSTTSSSSTATPTISKACQPIISTPSTPSSSSSSSEAARNPRSDPRSPSPPITRLPRYLLRQRQPTPSKKAKSPSSSPTPPKRPRIPSRPRTSSFIASARQQIQHHLHQTSLTLLQNSLYIQSMARVALAGVGEEDGDGEEDRLWGDVFEVTRAFEGRCEGEMDRLRRRLVRVGVLDGEEIEDSEEDGEDADG